MLLKNSCKAELLGAATLDRMASHSIESQFRKSVVTKSQKSKSTKKVEAQPMDAETGVELLKNLTPPKLTREEELEALVKPYRQHLIDARKKGNSKTVLIETLQKIIGRRVTYKQLDEILDESKVLQEVAK